MSYSLTMVDNAKIAAAVKKIAERHSETTLVNLQGWACEFNDGNEYFISTAFPTCTPAVSVILSLPIFNLVIKWPYFNTIVQ